MLNILGHIPPVATVLAVKGAHLHLYGKAPTEKRKLGHVTLVAQSEEPLDQRIRELVGALGQGEDAL
jgi:5-(carboxyamino)imidazole ribonucleotide synthase